MVTRRMSLMVASLAAMFVLAFSSLAFAQGQSTVTQEDCDNGRITRNGEVLRGEACERLIGQRVRLADTGFDAWMFLAGGGVLLTGAFVLRRRMRGAGPALA